MSSNGFEGGFPADFERLARQYWNAWGAAMRAGAAPAQATAPGWGDALGWWAQLAKAPGATAAGSGADEAVERFNAQARQWFGQMQQLAAQFAGQDANASDIARAWQQMLGADAGKVFADLFKHMQGPGQHGIDQWMEQAAPWLQSLQREGRNWLGLPAFGFSREHQERWQALMQAQLDYQDKSNAYNALMGEAMQLALRRFEDKLIERSEPGRQLTSARALFDLWIDAAEDAYAEVALSPRFGEAYGEMVNAQMKVRAGLQREVEQYCRELGIPGRTEVDAAHRRIAQLERELRRLRDAIQVREPAPPAGPAARPAGRAAERAGTKPAKKAKKETGR